MNMRRVGVDLAKQVFQVLGVDTHERVVCRRQPQELTLVGYEIAFEHTSRTSSVSLPAISSRLHFR